MTRVFRMVYIYIMVRRSDFKRIMERNIRAPYISPEIEIVVSEHLLDTELVRISGEVYEGDAKGYQMSSFDDDLWSNNDMWGLSDEEDFLW